MNTFKINTARENLTRFILLNIAKEIQNASGVGYAALPEIYCPTDGDAIADQWGVCLLTGKPYPVSSDNSEDTIYTVKEGNYIFRFWHDWLHFRYEKHTSFQDEIELGKLHIQRIASRFGADSTECKLIAIDTIGQSAYCYKTGVFPAYQLGFAVDCLTSPDATYKQLRDAIKHYSGIAISI
jgi:hypothetical protein